MRQEAEAIRILVVDDEASVREAYRSILAPPRDRTGGLDALEAQLFGGRVGSVARLGPDHVDFAAQGEEAHERVVAAVAEGKPYAVAFVDMRMPPGWDGLHTIERIWEADPDVQVVIATAYSDHSWSQVLDRLGRTDGLLLLKKPFDPCEVWQLASALGTKWRLARSTDRELAESKRLAARLRDANSELEKEVEERRAAEERLFRHAYYDSLTGLPNRMRLIERLERAFTRAKTDPRHGFAVLFLDLDSFKLVNDSLGHDMGDRLLIEVAYRLSEGLRSMDAVMRLDEDAASRLGGDEFVVVLDGILSPRDAAAVAERLLHAVSEPIDLGVQQVALSGSVGIAVFGPHYESADAILRDADTAMYRAKAHKSRLALFDPAMHMQACDRLRIESDLRRAVEQKHFSLVFQPIVHAGTRRIAALEALCRWNHPDYPYRAPAAFIPVAEETGLIVPLGRWLFHEACRALAELRELSPDARDVRISVNVSRRQLLDPRLPEDVRATLDATGVPANRVDLEITESAIIGDVDAALARLTELKRLGVGLHLDDFGTGYSSLSCLQTFPLDVVKIDRSFVSSMGNSKQSAAIVEAVVTLAHRLGMQVTVEGVETEPQLSAVRELGSDYAQGYLLHRPIAIESVKSLFEARGGRVAENAALSVRE